jgi:hypothetical protein
VLRLTSWELDWGGGGLEETVAEPRWGATTTPRESRLGFGARG